MLKIFLLATLAGAAHAQPLTLAFKPHPGALAIILDGRPLPLVLSQQDYAGVSRAARSLAADMAKVGGR